MIRLLLLLAQVKTKGVSIIYKQGHRKGQRHKACPRPCNAARGCRACVRARTVHVRRGGGSRHAHVRQKETLLSRTRLDAGVDAGVDADADADADAAAGAGAAGSSAGRSVCIVVDCVRRRFCARAFAPPPAASAALDAAAAFPWRWRRACACACAATLRLGVERELRCACAADVGGGGRRTANDGKKSLATSRRL